MSVRSFCALSFALFAAAVLLTACPSADAGTWYEPEESWDARDFVIQTDVKDQGKYDIGWAFALSECIESILFRDDIEPYEPISPLFIAGGLFAMDNSVIPNDNEGITLRNVDIDSAMYILMNGYCSVRESQLPYSSAKDDFISNYEMKEWNVMRVTDYVRLPIDTETNMMKAKTQLMMSGGGGVMSLYIDDDTSLYRFDGKDLSYFSGYVDSVPNHCVQVVGWDDKYSRTNFSGEVLRDGAWLVRDSRGTVFGGQEWSGYMWVSYESVMSQYFYFITDYEECGLDTQMYWDTGLSPVDKIDFTDIMVQFGSIFRSPSDCYLSEVSIPTYGNVGIEYEFSVYKQVPEKAADPTQGTKYGSPFRFTPDAEGVFTYRFEEPIPLFQYERFSILFSIFPGKEFLDVGTFSVPIDRSCERPSYKSKTSVSMGECFYSLLMSEDMGFVDMSTLEDPCALRIRAVYSESKTVKQDTEDGVTISYKVLSEPNGRRNGTVTVGVDGKRAIPRTVGGEINIPSLVIANGSEYDVVEISPEAFSMCRWITAVDIPPTVKYVGMWAFNRCDSLFMVRISDSTTEIDDAAFDLEMRDGSRVLLSSEYHGYSYHKYEDEYFERGSPVRTVTFDVAGGSTDVGPVNYDTEAGFLVPGYNGVRDAKIFSGWLLGGILYAEGDVIEGMNSNYTLEAYWTDPVPAMSDIQFTVVAVMSVSILLAIAAVTFRRLR